MTAGPSRRTSTVSVSKRNSLGRRTAWLRPVQKTFARLVALAMVGINDIYFVQRKSSALPLMREPADQIGTRSVQPFQPVEIDREGGENSILSNCCVLRHRSDVRPAGYAAAHAK